MRRLLHPLWILAGLALLLALVLPVDAIPFLRGGFGWQWPYDPVPLAHVLPLLVAVIVYVGGAWWLLRRANRTGLLIAWAFAGVVALSLAGLWLRSDDVLYELFARTASGVTTGQHLAGVEIDWSNPNWVDWPVTVAPFAGRSGHIVLSGPLLPIWYGVLNAVLTEIPSLATPMQRALIAYQCRNYDLLVYTPAQWASAWFGMWMPVWAALAVFPLFAVARRLLDSQAARLAVAWWPLVPALILFAPTWNTLYPFAALVAFWMLLRGLDGGAGWLIASGLVCGLLTFANFSMLPLLGLCGFYALLYLTWYARRRWVRLVIAGVLFGIGLASPWVVFWLVGGSTPLDLFNFAMANHLILERPYLPWLWLHAWEWALLTGLPLVALWLWGAARRHVNGAGYGLTLSLLLTMGVLIFSGTARGETGRVWLFFAPFVLICAAGALQTLKRTEYWLTVSVGQAALLMAVSATWLLINAPNMTPPPAPPGTVEAQRPGGMAVSDAFRLVNWDAQVVDGHVELRLDWEAQAQMTTPYWFAALLVAPDGSTPVETHVWQALNTRYPTTCWKPGEVVGDVVDLPLPEAAQPGDWWISLSVFADKQHPEDRLPVRLPDESTDDQIGLGPVTVR